MATWEREDDAERAVYASRCLDMRVARVAGKKTGDGVGRGSRGSQMGRPRQRASELCRGEEAESGVCGWQSWTDLRRARERWWTQEGEESESGRAADGRRDLMVTIDS